MKTTRCRNCNKQSKINGRLSSATCEHCGSELLGHHKIKCHVICPNCKTMNIRDHFGWVETACTSCGTVLKHPARKSKGGSRHRGKVNGAQLSLVLETQDYDEIVRLSKFYNTTKGAIARYVLKVGLDKLP